MKRTPKHKKLKFTPLQANAALVAMNVRNSMENFHVEHLSDAQMKELNPIIRNAIYEALLMFSLSEQGSEAARRSLHWLWLCLPNYWEPPRANKYLLKYLGLNAKPKTKRKRSESNGQPTLR